MGEITTYKDLDAWARSMELVTCCYRLTASFPDTERYGLTGQMRRAACSIPSNLAEGFCRRSIATYVNHVSIALGSHGELETYVELAFRLGFLSSSAREELVKNCDCVGRLLTGLRRALTRKMNAARPSA